MDTSIPTSTSNAIRITNNGYQAILYENGSHWRLLLTRIDSGVGTPLVNLDLGSGALGQYKWFHLRLDFLLQPNNDALLQLFENDLVSNPINPSNPPTWGTSWTKIAEVSELAADVPAYSRVGWGGQVEPGAGSIYETYADWIEIWYS
jgi:hypothetical protein